MCLSCQHQHVRRARPLARWSDWNCNSGVARAEKALGSCSPVQIHIEDIQQTVSSRLVTVPAHTVEKVGNDDIGADNGVGRPFRAEVDHALEDVSGSRSHLVVTASSSWRLIVQSIKYNPTHVRRIHEDVLAEDTTIARLGETLTSEDAEEGRLPS